LNNTTGIQKGNIIYKCGWSPMEGYSFPAAIVQTFVNGNVVYSRQDNYGNYLFDESVKGQRLSFDR
jgi:dihydroorotase